MASEPGKPWHIYVVSAEGGGLRQLTTGTRNHGDPDWSSDGSLLAFGGLAVLEADNATAIYMLDLRTQKVSTMPRSEGLSTPRWSPDGRYLAAQTSDGQKLVMFDFTTRKWEDLADIFIGYENWSRDGKYLYFDSSLGTDPALYRVRISDRKLERVVSLKEVGSITGQTGGPWSGLTPDDSPLVLRDISSQEIYALDWEAP